MDEMKVKELVEKLGNKMFNHANWCLIAERFIDEDKIDGGLIKVTGKHVKEQLVVSSREVSKCVRALVEEVLSIPKL